MSVAELIGQVVLFPMTSDQFCKLPPSDTVKLELLDGKVVVLTRPTRDHQHFIFQLGVVIDRWVKRHNLGRILLDVLVKLDGRWTPAPDLVFVAKKNLKRAKTKRIEGPVDLAVEILSPSHPEVDRETKFEAYAEFGIRWYWNVDLEKRVLEEYELEEGAFANKVEVSFDEVFEPRLFPGLKIDLASLEW